MKRHGFTTEAQLVERAAEWLRADGWDVHFEVAPWGAGAARADLVGVRGPLLAVVECKLSLSLAVLEQCQTWTRFAHLVWAAVPRGKRNGFALQVADWMGTGIMSLGEEGWARSVLQLPRLRRGIDAKLKRALNEDQKRTVPGTNSGYSTPFRETCTRLLVAVRDAGGRLAVKAAMADLRHHYSSAACARASLIERTERGVVPGLSIERSGRDVFFRAEAQLASTKENPCQ